MSNLTRQTNYNGELVTEKYCPRCGEWWPIDDPQFWNKCKRNSDGLDGYCRACRLEKHYESYGKPSKPLMIIGAYERVMGIKMTLEPIGISFEQERDNAEW